MQKTFKNVEKALGKINRQHTQGRPGYMGCSLGYIEVGPTLVKSICIQIDR